MKEELIVEAVVDNLEIVNDFVHRFISQYQCSKRTVMQLDLIIEEIFVNIASYAYAPDTGSAKISLEIVQEPLKVTLTFIDTGIPYNPLINSDPDISLGVEDRQIGGLGIFLTKKLVNDISYRYEDGQNILQLTKSLTD